MTREEIRKAEIERNRQKNIPQQRVNGELIVSLTTYGERIAKCHEAVQSILDQTYKADRVVVWIAQGEKASAELEAMPIEIRYCKDLKSYKKLTPALKAFPDAYIVTADDDLIYKDSWLATLMMCYFKAREKYPQQEFIAAHRCHEIAMSNGNTLPYQYWKFVQKADSYGHYYFQTGAGVMFPPHSLSEEALNEDLQLSLSPHCDETFYVACAIKNKMPICTTGRLMPFRMMHYVHGLWNDYNVREKSTTLGRVWSHFGIKDVPKFKLNTIKLDLTQKADNLVVLLTTYPPRQEGCLEVVRDLQKQTLKPDRIILSLAKSNYASKSAKETLKPFEDLGVEIYWTNDTKTIKQYYPVINELKGNVIISLADDFKYDENTIRDLYASYLHYGRQFPISGSPLRWNFDKSGRLSNYGGASIFLADWCLPYFPQIVENLIKRQNRSELHKLFVDPMMTYAINMNGKKFQPSLRNFYVKQEGGWSSGDTNADDIKLCHEHICRFLRHNFEKKAIRVALYKKDKDGKKTS